MNNFKANPCAYDLYLIKVVKRTENLVYYSLALISVVLVIPVGLSRILLTKLIIEVLKCS